VADLRPLIERAFRAGRGAYRQAAAGGRKALVCQGQQRQVPGRHVRPQAEGGDGSAGSAPAKKKIGRQEKIQKLPAIVPRCRGIRGYGRKRLIP